MNSLFRVPLVKEVDPAPARHVQDEDLPAVAAFSNQLILKRTRRHGDHADRGRKKSLLSNVSFGKGLFLNAVYKFGPFDKSGDPKTGGI